MAGTTISGYRHANITLSGPTYANPVEVTGTIAGTGSVAALYGNDATAWTVDNAGSITGYLGIYLTGGGTVTNAGSIDGTGSASYGVRLSPGGTVTNAASGSIAGGLIGVFVYRGAGTLVNSGSIAGTGTKSTGVWLNSAGSVTNAASASVTGDYRGVLIEGGTGVVVNYGSITGTGLQGVDLYDGGSVTNAAAASIIGNDYAVRIESGVGTVINDGTIVMTGTTGDAVLVALTGSVVNNGSISAQGANAFGIHLFTGGSATNATSASITAGAFGINIGAAGSVLNDGGITAGEYGVFCTHGGSITNAAGASITAGTDGVLIRDGAGTVVNAGGIVGARDAVALAAGYANRVIAAPAASFGGTVDGGNSIGSTVVSTLELASAASAGTLGGVGSSIVNFAAITFDPGAAWSVSGDLAGLAGGETIAGFAPGDTIGLAGVTATGSSYAGGALTLDTGAGAVTLDLPGSFSTTSFVIANVAGAADISLAPCFAAGTRVLTLSGEVAVQALRIGDRVPVLQGGRLARVRWIGRRRVDCRHHPKPAEVRPVRIAAGAFGDRAPHRDLFVSPDHAVHVGEVLIPVRYLVNGATVAQIETDEVTYWHVELDRHGVLLAEGLAAESYLDTGNRAAFENGGVAVHAHPDFSLRIWETQACAPLVAGGPRLTAAKTSLLRRAAELGHLATADPGLHLVVDGRRVPPSRDGGICRFALPGDARIARLASRRFVPAQMFAELADHRRLGVAISALRLNGRAVALDDARLTDGWHAPERRLRWTDGDAGFALAGVRELAFKVALAGRYWRDVPTQARLCRPSQFSAW